MSRVASTSRRAAGDRKPIVAMQRGEDCMKSLLVFAMLGIASLAMGGQDTADRPKITGIDHVAFYTTAPEGVAHLYRDVLGLSISNPLEPGETLRYWVGKQWVGFSSAPNPQALDRMDHVGFATDDLAALQRYLAKKGVTAPATVERWPDGSRSFRVKDPEGHVIEIVGPMSAAAAA